MDESEEFKRVRTWEFGEPMSRAMMPAFRCNGRPFRCSGDDQIRCPFSTPPYPSTNRRGTKQQALQRDIYVYTHMHPDKILV
jgi:hypothetical protein